MAAQGEMLKLGDFIFSVSTAAYQKLQRQTSWRWSKLDRIGRTPSHQYIGPDDDTVTLDGTIYTGYGPGLAPAGAYQMENLRIIGDSGKPQMLVDGRGNVYGNYVLASIREGSESFLRDGTPRKQTFSIELERYGDDDKVPVRFSRSRTVLSG